MGDFTKGSVLAPRNLKGRSSFGRTGITEGGRTVPIVSFTIIRRCFSLGLILYRLFCAGVSLCRMFSVIGVITISLNQSSREPLRLRSSHQPFAPSEG